MRNYIITIIIFLLFISPYHLLSQSYDTIRIEQNEVLLLSDTLHFGKTDSMIIIPSGQEYEIKEKHEVQSQAFYDSLEARTKNKKLLYELYKSLWLQQQEIRYDPHEFNKANQDYLAYQGKTIREIKFKQVDLFEGTVSDTSVAAKSEIGLFFNRLHFDTRIWAIRNNLRFKPYDVLHPEIIAENERLLRGLSFLQDARITLHTDSINSDSVDVLVVTQDNFPIGLDGEIYSATHYSIEPYTRNFLGMGHSLSGSLIIESGVDQPIGWGLRYKIQNMFKAFTSITFDYANTNDEDLLRFTFAKPFLTNDIKWGGEFDVYRIKEERSWNHFTRDTVYSFASKYTSDVLDTWVGRSIFLNPSDPSSHFNVSARYLTRYYSDRPFVKSDSNMVFHNNNTYLMGLTYRHINYFKTTKLLGYGITEDVPYGHLFQVISGIQDGQFVNRPYFGFSGAWANYFDRMGYLVYMLNLGGYTNENSLEDFIIETNLFYFSPLISMNRFEIRHFFSPVFRTTINGFYNTPSNFGNLIRGLKQDGIYGRSDLVLRYESLFYTPYSLLGFKLSLSPFLDAGWISPNQNFSGRKDFYSVLGLDIRIKNESLTIPTFAIRMGYYPTWVEGGSKLKISFIFADKKIFKDMFSFKPRLLE